MNLILDIGNTRVKWALFEDDTLTLQGTVSSDSLPRLCRQYPWTCAAVCASGQADLSPLTLSGRPVHVLGPDSQLPIAVDYATPRTLGPDRIASACGAWKLFPNSNSLIIDAGTCITIDFVDVSGTYRGGAILPGLDMKFRALHTFTARLPLLENVEGFNHIVTGRSTAESLTAGVLTATRFAVQGFIQHYTSLHGAVNILLTGGDSARLWAAGSPSLPSASFHPDLVLTGLNVILKQNEK